MAASTTPPPPELPEQPEPPDDLRRAVDAVLPGARTDLEALVRIPSIWADPAHAEDTRRCADAVATLAREAGAADVGIVAAEGGAPAVVAHWPAPGGRADRPALRPPRRPAHRRRRAVDHAAVRARRARRPPARPRCRRRQGGRDDPPRRAAGLRRPPAGRRHAVRRGRGGVRAPPPFPRCSPSTTQRWRPTSSSSPTPPTPPSTSPRSPPACAGWRTSSSRSRCSSARCTPGCGAARRATP